MISPRQKNLARRISARLVREGDDALTEAEKVYINVITYVYLVRNDFDFGFIFGVCFPAEEVVKDFERIGHAQGARTAALARRIYRIDRGAPELCILGRALLCMEGTIADRLQALQAEHGF